MNQENKDEVVYLYLDDIIPNRFQPREVFDERALKELAVSIKEHGVIQPIIVRNVNGKYEIIAGERRYKASALAGLTKIPAIIRNLDDKESSKVALLENLQRKNLNPIEEARTYQKILELDQMTQEELAKTMGKSQSAVANKIRLLGLSNEVQEALLKEQISERHARTLLNIPDNKKQKDMLKKVVNEKMTVRQLEQAIKDLYPKEEQKGASMNQSMNIPSSPITASASDFVNSNPLMPTTELPEDTTNYGKITIAPPEGEGSSGLPKFINYGEINDEEDNEEDPAGGFNFLSNQKTPSIEDIKANSTDIHAVSSKPTADLDNLLNIPSPSTSTQDSHQESYKFVTPAEEIVKTDAKKAKQERVEDYFKTPDLISVDLPSEVQTRNTDNLSLTDLSKDRPSIIQSSKATSSLFDDDTIKTQPPKKSDKFTIQKSIDMIRNLVNELNNHGVTADIDEMNFSKSYQIIIKLDKTQEEEK